MSFLLLSLLIIVLASTTTAFTIQQQASARTSSSSPRLCLSASSGSIQRPANEFSREYQVDRILSSGNSRRQRDYRVSIEATSDELQNLAQRFALENLYSLEADLSLRRERGSGSKGIVVEGTVMARVTQVCVRTGEIFDVDVEFPLFAVSRPIAVTTTSTAMEEEQLPAELLEYRSGLEKKTKKKQRNNMPLKLQEVDLDELNKLLSDFDAEDDVIEDEAIYSSSGILDAGELVAQLFWLKLDPYPKKPGSDPVTFSISG